MSAIPMPPEVDECDAARDYYARNEALIEGQRIGRLGLSLNLNPYSPGTSDHDDFVRGWHSAQARRAAEQLSRRARFAPCRYVKGGACDCGGNGRCLDVA